MTGVSRRQAPRAAATRARRERSSCARIRSAASAAAAASASVKPEHARFASGDVVEDLARRVERRLRENGVHEQRRMRHRRPDRSLGPLRDHVDDRNRLRIDVQAG